MTKEEALNEYKEALKTALEKRRQYTYYCFKELNTELSEELLNNIADTCTQTFFERKVTMVAIIDCILLGGKKANWK